MEPHRKPAVTGHRSLAEGLQRCAWVPIAVPSDSDRVRRKMDTAIAVPALARRIFRVKLDETAPGDVHPLPFNRQAVSDTRPAEASDRLSRPGKRPGE